ncbi:MAG: DUF6010 family protein [Sandaracinaceae bacterium]
MHRPFPTSPMEWIGPALAGLAFIAVMSRFRDPARRHFNAVLVGGAMGAYISGGLGLWELPFAAVGSYVAYRGLSSYRMIGVAWFMHSAWDLVHHLFGDPIWPFMETSSFGCLILDAVIGAWFVLDARFSRASRESERLRELS